MWRPLSDRGYTDLMGGGIGCSPKNRRDEPTPGFRGFERILTQIVIILIAKLSFNFNYNLVES